MGTRSRGGYKLAETRRRVAEIRRCRQWDKPARVLPVQGKRLRRRYRRVRWS